MKRETESLQTPEERELIAIIRRLPLERVAEVIDFAQFLEFQQTKTRPAHDADEASDRMLAGSAAVAADERQNSASSLLNFTLEASWQARLQAEMRQDYIQELFAFARQEYATKIVYPPADRLFAAFEATPFERVNVVILGQDPYHGADQANGLCFSVNDGVPLPPSLKNIFLEIRHDLGAANMPTSGNLMRWASQGALLLNAILTVVEKTPRSHQNKGWERLTDEVIRIISREREHVVFLLWGAYAQAKAQLIEHPERHLMLYAAHPSPLSAKNGFFGCRHFSQANAFLQAHGLPAIEW